MTRNASDCLLCHLTGLFADQRLKEYDEWLLQEIEQTKGLAFPAIHFSALHSALNISTMWKEKETRERLSEIRGKFDVLQMDIDDASDKQCKEFLEWNQKLDQPFHIFAVLTVQAVKDSATVSITDSYQRLRQVIEAVFTLCKFPVDGISFAHADFLWKESADAQCIEPRNHYLLRHIRSAMDRIGALQTLFVHSEGGFKDVNEYFSDGNNEVQLAGSVEMNAALVKSLQEENTGALAGITSQFRLNSLESAYFHALGYFEQLNDKQKILAQTLLLCCSGMPVLNVESLDTLSLDKVLDLRMKNPALHVHGAQIQLGNHEKIWAIQRYSMDISQSLLCLANFSGEEQQIHLGEEDLVPDESWQDVFSGQTFIAGQRWALKPYQILTLI